MSLEWTFVLAINIFTVRTERTLPDAFGQCYALKIGPTADSYSNS